MHPDHGDGSIRRSTSSSSACGTYRSVPTRHESVSRCPMLRRAASGTPFFPRLECLFSRSHLHTSCRKRIRNSWPANAPTDSRASFPESLSVIIALRSSTGRIQAAYLCIMLMTTDRQGVHVPTRALRYAAAGHRQAELATIRSSGYTRMASSEPPTPTTADRSCSSAAPTWWSALEPVPRQRPGVAQSLAPHRPADLA